jgi:hypothetical protein
MSQSTSPAPRLSLPVRSRTSLRLRSCRPAEWPRSESSCGAPPPGRRVRPTRAAEEHLVAVAVQGAQRQAGALSRNDPATDHRSLPRGARHTADHGTCSPRFRHSARLACPLGVCVIIRNDQDLPLCARAEVLEADVPVVGWIELGVQAVPGRDRGLTAVRCRFCRSPNCSLRGRASTGKLVP